MFSVLDMLLGTGARTVDLSQSSIQISIALRQDLTKRRVRLHAASDLLGLETCQALAA